MLQYTDKLLIFSINVYAVRKSVGNVYYIVVVLLALIV